MKQSERLVALVGRLFDELSEDERLSLTQAVQTAQRLEAGEGFSVHGIVSQSSGVPRLDICWMGMLAQVSMDQAREIGFGIFEACAEAESEAALLGFLRQELGFDDLRAASALHMIRQFRSAQRQPTQGSKPS